MDKISKTMKLQKNNIFAMRIRYENIKNFGLCLIAFCLIQADGYAFGAEPIFFMENQIEEIWKDVIEYEGLYQISNFGNVRSLITHNGTSTRLLKISIDRYGYQYVKLCKDKKHNNRTVHRLVTQAFIPNPENKKTVNHKNGIKTDNTLKNLEWATHSENNKEAYRIGLRDIKGEKAPSSKLTTSQILAIRENKENKLQKELAIQYGIHKAYVSQIILRKRWAHI